MNPIKIIVTALLIIVILFAGFGYSTTEYFRSELKRSHNLQSGGNAEQVESIPDVPDRLENVVLFMKLVNYHIKGKGKEGKDRTDYVKHILNKLKHKLKDFDVDGIIEIIDTKTGNNQVFIKSFLKWAKSADPALLKMTDDNLINLVDPSKNKYINLFYTHPINMMDNHVSYIIDRITKSLRTSSRLMEEHNYMLMVAAMTRSSSSEQPRKKQLKRASELKKQVKQTKKQLKQIVQESEQVNQSLQELSGKLDHEGELTEEEHTVVHSLATKASDQEAETETVLQDTVHEEESVKMNMEEAQQDLADVKQSGKLVFLEERVSANYNTIKKLDRRMVKIDQLSRNVQSLIRTNRSLLDDIRSKLLANNNSNVQADNSAFNGLASNGYSSVATKDYYKNLETAQKIRDSQKNINKCPMTLGHSGPVDVLEVSNQRVGSTVPVVGI